MIAPKPCGTRTYNDVYGLTSISDCKLCIKGYACFQKGIIKYDYYNDNRYVCLKGVSCPEGVAKS